MICATCKHRIWSECAGAGAVLHLVAAEFDHELGIDSVANQARV